MLRRVVVMLVVAAGCRAYQPGSLTVSSVGELRRVGCLDVSIEPDADAEAVGPVARITFANRCDAAVRVDLAAIRATARLGDGRRVTMRMFDPALVVRPGLLEARSAGSETIEFQVPGDPTAHALELCLDLAGVDAGADLDRPVIACLGGSAPAVAEVAP